MLPPALGITITSTLTALALKGGHAGSVMEGLKQREKSLNSYTNREDLDLAGKSIRMFCTDRQESHAGVFPIFFKTANKKKDF